ncbi:MAG: hypothetical protein II299_02150 [Alistipes sp.]|nr:hypothetical protein [Alistipes sp.]
MYRSFIISLLAILAVGVAQAQHSAQEVVGCVAEYVKKLGSYEVKFVINASEYLAEGSYSVAGDDYHIRLPQAEVYSDGEIRYEIDHERKEVNVDVVDLSSRNVLDNPTRCFDFVGEEYDVTIAEKSEHKVVLRIVATDDAFEGEIYLSADAKGKPMELMYKLYEDTIKVEIKSIATHKAKLPTFTKSAYKDYDIIDFR